jgi:hypothetical protein
MSGVCGRCRRFTASMPGSPPACGRTRSSRQPSKPMSRSNPREHAADRLPAGEDRGLFERLVPRKMHPPEEASRAPPSAGGEVCVAAAQPLLVDVPLGTIPRSLGAWRTEPRSRNMRTLLTGPHPAPGQRHGRVRQGPLSSTPPPRDREPGELECLPRVERASRHQLGEALRWSFAKPCLARLCWHPEALQDEPRSIDPPGDS